MKSCFYWLQRSIIGEKLIGSIMKALSPFRSNAYFLLKLWVLLERDLRLLTTSRKMITVIYWWLWAFSAWWLTTRRKHAWIWEAERWKYIWEKRRKIIVFCLKNSTKGVQFYTERSRGKATKVKAYRIWRNTSHRNSKTNFYQRW